VVIGGDYITTESGTGLVHTAPGHGQEDYQTGLKYDLPLYSPVDDAGNFTEDAGGAPLPAPVSQLRFLAPLRPRPLYAVVMQ
jgi:isoleucyl-tRNA synthetase